MISCITVSMGSNTPLLHRDQVQLRGDHNVMNVLAAFAIGYAAGLPLDAMLSAAKDFQAVAHRLEFVRDLEWFQMVQRLDRHGSRADHGCHLFFYGTHRTAPWRAR